MNVGIENSAGTQRSGVSPVQKSGTHSLTFITLLYRRLNVVLPQFAVLCLLLFTGPALAQEQPAVRMKMELMSIRNRSSGPLPVRIKLEYNKPQILEGDLELSVYDAVNVVSRDDLMATLRFEDIVLAGGDKEFNIVLPPLKTAVTQNWAVAASFVTRQGSIPLSSLPERPGNAEPFDLLTTSPLERGVLLCSCFKETRRNSESANRRFLETALSLDNYNPIYPEVQTAGTSTINRQRTGSQKAEQTGHTIIHFAGQWSSHDLPQDPLSYCAFDVVLLADESLAALQTDQLDGLTAWVRAGGSVCIVPDVPMKPLQLEFLRKLFEQEIRNSVSLTLDSEGQLLVVSDETNPVLLSQCGLGRAVLLPAVEDLSSALTKEDLGEIVAFLWKVRKDQPVWRGESWRTTDNPQAAGRQSYQTERDDRLSPQPEPLLSVAEQALLPSDVEMVPTWIIGMILMGYVMAIGPGDYFLLGWLRLRKYTWVLFPVITAVFTLLTVMVANAFMGSEDTGGKLVITDLRDHGLPVRQTTLETLYYSSQATVTNDHQGELVVLAEDHFSGLEYGSPYGQQQQTQDSPLSYSGRFPQSYSIRHRVQQWSPVSLRTLSLEPQECEVPPIDWNDTSLLTSQEGNTRLIAALTQHLLAIQKKSGPQSQCFATIYHENKVQDLLGSVSRQNDAIDAQYRRLGYPPAYYHNRNTAAQTMMASIPTVKVSNRNIFGLVSQISPQGAGSLEDLAFLDGSDSSQWALVVIEQKGEDVHVFRKLYVIKP